MNKTETYKAITETIPEDYKIQKTYTYTQEWTEYILIKQDQSIDKEELQAIRKKLKENENLKDYIIHIGNIDNEILIQIVKKGKVKK